jgi:hypothetical protein
VLRNKPETNRDEIKKKKILHNEELHDLYSSLDTIRVIKSKGKKWTGNAKRCGEERNAYRVLVGKAGEEEEEEEEEEENHLEYLGGGV